MTCLLVLLLICPVLLWGAEVRGLYGIHDADPDPSEYLNHIKAIAGGGWVTATVAVGHNPSDVSSMSFAALANAGHTVICRMNNGYFPDGTIPLATDYDNFARRCSNFVVNSSGCNLWVIGNEVNLNGEWPNNGTKFPYLAPTGYAACFRKVYNAIKAARPNDKVMPAPPAPFAGPYGAGTASNGMPYDGNSLSWVQYLNQMLTAIASTGPVDGIPLHITSRGYTTNAIYSTQQVSAGGQSLYFSFFVYKDWVDYGIPSSLWNLPLYATECNGYYYWKGGHPENPSAHYEAGWMQEIYAEINRYNQSALSVGKPIYRCINMYRWCASCDPWNIDGASDTYKTQILSDLDSAVSQNYQWPLPLGPPATLVSTGSVWKYLDDGSNQGTGWRNTNYNDSAWASGHGLLGYGDSEATYVRSNRTDGSRIITTYFRRPFTVNNPSTIGTLAVRLLRDDGAVVYLNGLEQFRSNMPTNSTILYDTLASTTIGGTDETTYFNYAMDPNALVSGTNLLAVEIHQVSTTSSDVSFDLELLAFSNQAPSVQITSPTNGAMFGAPTNVFLAAAANDAEGPAKVDFSIDGFLFARLTNFPFSTTWTNAPEGSHTMLAVATDGRGLSTTSAPVSIRLCPALVRSGSIWKYRDTGNDLGAGWSASAFDDRAWASGPAQLGYGDGDEATVVSYGSDPNNKYITTYFRRAFDVPDPFRYTNLLCRLIRDDGAVVYVNGQEAYRANMPSGPINFSTPALTTIGNADETNVVDTFVNPGMLVAGTNVIAVEMHQSSGTSSDLSFDLEVLGLRPVPPTSLSLQLANSQILLLWPDSSLNFRVESTASLAPGVLWTNVSGVVSNSNGLFQMVLPISSQNRFFRLTKP
ncbi:MAG TPA: Ig-like domain-containing protein [Verrucomicrobiae bacterium]